MHNSSESFQSRYAEFQRQFEIFAKQRFEQKSLQLSTILGNSSKDTSYKKLLESMEYSFFNGGKRFRPVVGLAVAKLMKLKKEDVLSWLLAIEMIHTYSLIHDDLPCMDNDDVRRGLPTNHIRFGEATALLAGDALLTDSFGELGFIANSKAVPKLIQILSSNAGLNGMITGQVMDIHFDETCHSIADGKDQLKVLQQIHHLKTARLIQLACEGCAYIADLNDSTIALVRNFGFNLGYSFQVADDILDTEENEKQNMVTLIGLDASQATLAELTEVCQQDLKILSNIFNQPEMQISQQSKESEFLQQLIIFNHERKK
ncbi:MAG: polyprenyl synthetase family protein [Pseudobdellovibrionaceae bacterium]